MRLPDHLAAHDRVWPAGHASAGLMATASRWRSALKGKDLLFIAGGIGLAPLRSVINYVRDKRENYGKVQIVYGSRSKEDLVDYQEIINEWMKDDGVQRIPDHRPGAGGLGRPCRLCSQLCQGAESGYWSKTVLMCGPPIMIKFTLAGLKELGFKETQVYTTMELRMKCGVGKCGRCNIGNKYVCKDGPVFRFDQLDELPSEY